MPRRDPPRRRNVLDGEVHVWMADLASVRSPAREAACLRLLDDSERERRQRFLFDEHRHQFLVSHALVRETLSRYAPVEPAAWRFRANEHGRPEVAHAASERLRFNLSHTDGLAACAVVHDADVGVDVEDTQRQGETVQIADRYFAPDESATLRALAPDRQRDAFFEYWTLKESYIKARGAGLTIPLRSFSFDLRDGAPPRIRIDPSLADDPSRWQFVSARPTERHRAAVAVGVERATPLLVRWRWTVPGTEPVG
jgi:4'-phosphopantetheinyl transferase